MYAERCFFLDATVQLPVLLQTFKLMVRSVLMERNSRALQEGPGRWAKHVLLDLDTV